MKKFLFVLGSNWHLSIAELDHLLKFSQYKGKIVDYSANIAIVEFDKLTSLHFYINELEEIQFTLGGCQKIAEIYDFIDIHTIKDAFPERMERIKLMKKARKRIIDILNQILVGKGKIFPKVYESMFFAVSIYPNLFDDKYYSKILLRHLLPFLNKEIMNVLKEKGAEKCLYYKYPEENIQAGNLNPIFPHHLKKYKLFSPNRAEIIFGFTEEGMYIARTITADDPNFKRKIDEERPYKDFKSSISPKLALTMLNFLNLYENREKKTILDPFVGNGTIFLLALLQDFDVYGCDIDQNKVDNTIRNVNWLLEELELPMIPLINERIKKIDVSKLSSHFKAEFFDGICTEPPLGPFFIKEKPYYIEAREIVENELEPIYNQLFSESYKILKPNARICLVSPVISTIDGKDVQINTENIAISHGFKLEPILDLRRIVNKSNFKLRFNKKHTKNLMDAKRGQIVKRKIFVFRKK
ncbi:MAG: TRM11 family SAM-dependent methyltransferase [Promethearchaeota archaeon]